MLFNKSFESRALRRGAQLVVVSEMLVEFKSK
jgi:hypothetical protein